MMIGVATIGAVVAVLLVGVVVLVRRPEDVRWILRCSALAITVLVAAALTPYTVDDSGAAAGYLLGVPVVAALLPVLAQRIGRLGLVVDLTAALVITGWGLLLGLGIGGAFLPAVVLLLAGAVSPSSPRPSTTA